MKGFKQQKESSPKKTLKELEVNVQNLQMALQMSQMMIKHLTNQISALQNDIGSSMGMLNDFQYRTLAMLELGKFDKDAIETKAEEFKLKDFNKASDKEDLEKGYKVDDDGVVTEDSIVIVTTSTPDTEVDQGIFRSKFPMSECLTPNLRKVLLGAKVGDTVHEDIYGIRHVMTILGIRKVEKQTQEQAGE